MSNVENKTANLMCFNKSSDCIGFSCETCRTLIAVGVLHPAFKSAQVGQDQVKQFLPVFFTSLRDLIQAHLADQAKVQPEKPAVPAPPAVTPPVAAAPSFSEPKQETASKQVPLPIEPAASTKPVNIIEKIDKSDKVQPRHPTVPTARRRRATPPVSSAANGAAAASKDDAGVKSPSDPRVSKGVEEKS